MLARLGTWFVWQAALDSLADNLDPVLHHRLPGSLRVSRRKSDSLAEPPVDHREDQSLHVVSCVLPRLIAGAARLPPTVRVFEVLN